MTDYRIIEDRRSFCKKRLDQFRRAVNECEWSKVNDNMCIYATGSYGRLEATEFSDLDIFLMNNDYNQNNITNIESILVKSDLIKISRSLGFPDFSGDGEYLKFYSLKSMIEMMGSPDDDYKNYFTARMLLMLESKPIYNHVGYENVLTEIIESYFRDYYEHSGDFRPIFVLNDIVRYWKTLCLNYENKRNTPSSRIMRR